MRTRTPRTKQYYGTCLKPIRGVFISQKAFVDKKWRKDCADLPKDIAMLAHHKTTGVPSYKDELDLKISKLKLKEASQAAK